MYYVNEDVKKTVRIFPEQGRYNYHRYDMNENPEGLPKKFVESVLREITPEFLATYPESDQFLNKYSKYIGAKFENICTTNGSDMAIRYLLEVFAEKGSEVLTVYPSFEMYGVNCSILGLKHVTVSYEKDLTVKIENILNAINEKTDIVVLLNPNNPIGTVYSEEDVESIITKAKHVNAIVIIDEAYHYFYEKTFLKYALAENNVVLLRTFSKLFSLAACRLGIIISNPEIINFVKNSKLTFDTNAIALKFGERILDNPDIINELIKTEREGKEYTLSELTKLGYEVIDCRGNYIFIKPKRLAIEVAKQLREDEKILVKTFNNLLLKLYLRVSIGSVNAMKFFLEKFLYIDNK